LEKANFFGKQTMIISILFFIVVSIAPASILPGCLAWQEMLPTRGHRSSHSSRPQQVLHSTTNEPPTIDLSVSTLEEVGDFESWFSSVDGADCNPYIKHASFGELRGLGTFDRSIGSGNSGSWMTIPRSITLESDFSQADWDAKLAEALWKEIAKGSSSPVKGYVSLLTKSWKINDWPAVPPFAAPDALRHWNDEEREGLAVHPEGQALLDLQKRQVRCSDAGVALFVSHFQQFPSY
jgi:hypothetical protein